MSAVENTPDQAAAVPAPREWTIEAYEDLVLDQHGYRISGPYVEQFWMPIVGPSAVVLLRLLNRRIGERLSEDYLAAACGLSGRREVEGRVQAQPRMGVVSHTLLRLERFRAAYRLSDERLAVRTHLAPLSHNLEERLHPQLRQELARWHRQSIPKDRR